MTVTARVEEVRENLIRACYRRDAGHQDAGGLDAVPRGRPSRGGARSPEGRAGCDGCTLCLLGRPETTTTIDAENRRGLPVAVGDTVEIFLSPAKAIRAAFFVLILPLLLFLALYGVAKEIAGIESQGANVLIGASGLIGGLLLNLGARKLRRDRDLPEVVRIVDAAASSSGLDPVGSEEGHAGPEAAP